MAGALSTPSGRWPVSLRSNFACSPGEVAVTSPGGEEGLSVLGTVEVHGPWLWAFGCALGRWTAAGGAARRAPGQALPPSRSRRKIRKRRTVTGTRSSAMAARKASAVGAGTAGASPGRLPDARTDALAAGGSEESSKPSRRDDDHEEDRRRRHRGSAARLTSLFVSIAPTRNGGSRGYGTGQNLARRRFERGALGTDVPRSAESPIGLFN